MELCGGESASMKVRIAKAFGGARAAFVALAAGLAGAAGPAEAQTNLIGYWNPLFHEDVDERIPGPSIGDYLGLPISDAARLRAEAWDASLLSMPEHQCKPHPSTYGFRGVGVLRIWEDRDEDTQQLLKIHTHIAWQEQHREIWMDGRPHPPEYAQHTWQGFSTGSWEGDVLVVKTTHLKAGWMRRNGLPLSDRATMTDRFHRYGDIMTHVMIVEDPVYLDRAAREDERLPAAAGRHDDAVPLRPRRSRSSATRASCRTTCPARILSSPSSARRTACRREATRGGAATALPEFAETLR